MTLTVEVRPANPALVRFLIETRAGSPGGVQVRDATPAIDRIPDAVWFMARDGDTLVGAYALVPRPYGWWRCHLTVAPTHADAATQALVHAASQYVPEADPAVVAGGSEAGHAVLRRCLVAAGYQEQAHTEVIAWSRRRAHHRVRPATPEDYDAILAQVKARGLHWTPAIHPEQFLVLRDQGEVVAGTVVHPLAWHIDALGPGSRITLPLLGLLGLDLHPLRFGAFLQTFGEAHHIETLWQGALHHSNLRVALVGGDVDDPRWPAWRALSRGRIGRVIGVSRQSVYARGSVPRPLDWAEDFLR